MPEWGLPKGKHTFACIRPAPKLDRVAPGHESVASVHFNDLGDTIVHHTFIHVIILPDSMFSQSTGQMTVSDGPTQQRNLTWDHAF